MIAVTDHFAISITEAHRCTDQPRIAVMERCHAVKDMRHAAGTVGDRHLRLFKGRTGMSNADNDSVLC